MKKYKTNVFKQFLKTVGVKPDTDFQITYTIIGDVITFNGTAALTGSNLEQLHIDSGVVRMKPEEHVCSCPHEEQDWDLDRGPPNLAHDW